MLDAKYHGNAFNILVQGEAHPAHRLGQPQLANNQNLDMIGETPNPDDEETIRF